MINQIFFASPLEQFNIVPFFCLPLGPVDFTITNSAVMFAVGIYLTWRYICASLDSADESSAFKKGVLHASKGFTIVPNKWQLVTESLYKVILSLVVDNIKNKENTKYFPLVFFLFMLIATLNSIGLVPYSFTLTSHLIVTLALSTSIFIGINIVCYRKHKLELFALFLPPGTSTALAFLLVPIELISYIFKPISLSIRLFANMMAGHTLLKVIAGFAFTLLNCTGVLFLIHYVPLLILVPLFALELGVALIQSFVFSILICIYLNDALNLH